MLRRAACLKVGNSTIEKNLSNGEKKSERKKSVPKDRVGKNCALGFCVFSGNFKWLIYQESDFTSTASHAGLVKRASVRVRWVGAGLCKWSRVTKSLFYSSLSFRSLFQQTPSSVYDTLAGNYFVQSVVTCTITGHALPGTQSPLILSLYKERGK